MSISAALVARSATAAALPRSPRFGIFPDEASITRQIGAVLLEQNDEWLLQHRNMLLAECPT
jgi:hypothetical protein